MRRHVLSRYERDPNGNILIDVAAGKVEDLYSNFDRSAPYIRRDLDPDLVDYLISCARELGNAPFTISFTFAHRPDGAREFRIKQSVKNFFLYLVAIERQKVRQMIARSLIFFCIGVVLLFVSVWLNRWLGPDRTVVANVFGEGITVAAWVSMWEALATFLVGWLPPFRDISLYRRLANVQPVFRVSAGTKPEPEKDGVPQSGGRRLTQ